MCFVIQAIGTLEIVDGLRTGVVTALVQGQILTFLVPHINFIKLQLLYGVRIDLKGGIAINASPGLRQNFKQSDAYFPSSRKVSIQTNTWGNHEEEHLEKNPRSKSIHDREITSRGLRSSIETPKKVLKH